MMVDSQEKRAALKFCFLLEKSAAETIVMFKTAFGEAALSKTQVYKKWLTHLKNGEMSIENQPRSGQPSTSKYHKLETVINKLKLIKTDQNKVNAIIDSLKTKT
uniref:Mos1 transposase HTH domain-containing protein n=1 Tax=Homalodisca liturata TaxID=320908 RepID=A0A1B6K4Y2_9HEMI